MRILGIDPGTQYLGIGIAEQAGRSIVHVAHELLTPKDFDALPDKLSYIYDSLRASIERYQPDAVSIENVFHGKNARSAIILAHARAVSILAAVKSGLPVFEYAPSQVKRAVGASGSAPKDVVMRMVCALLGLKEIERADCADALAIAICHLNRTGDARMAASSGSVSKLGEAFPAYASKLGSTGGGAKFTIVRRQSPAPAPPKKNIIRQK